MIHPKRITLKLLLVSVVWHGSSLPLLENTTELSPKKSAIDIRRCAIKVPFTPKNKFSQQFEPSSELAGAVTILASASMQINRPVTFSLADPDNTQPFAVVVAVSNLKHIKQLEELIDQWQK